MRRRSLLGIGSLGIGPLGVGWLVLGMALLLGGCGSSADGPVGASPDGAPEAWERTRQTFQAEVTGIRSLPVAGASTSP